MEGDYIRARSVSKDRKERGGASPPVRYYASCPLETGGLAPSRSCVHLQESREPQV